MNGLIKVLRLGQMLRKSQVMTKFQHRSIYSECVPDCDSSFSLLHVVDFIILILASNAFLK